MTHRLQHQVLVILLMLTFVLPACTIQPFSFHRERYTPPVPLDPDATIEDGVTYEVTLLVPRLPMINEGQSYEAQMQAIVQHYHDVRPQVAVKLSLVSLLNFWNVLQKQVETDPGPVVALNLYGPASPLSDPLPLPVTRFIEASKGSYWPVALQAVEADGNLWGWPSWLEPGLLLATQTAIEQTPIDEVYQLGTGWTPTEFRSSLSMIETQPVIASLGAPLQLFAAFVSAAGGPWQPFDASLKFQWTKEQLTQAAEQLAELVSTNLYGEADELPQSLLETVYREEIGVVTGIGPWALQQAHRQGQQSLLRVLPLPTGRAKPTTPVRIASLQVFQGHDQKSAAHYRVANDLARYVSSELGPWVADATFAFPAVQSSLERWAQRRGAEWSTSDPESWANIELTIAWTLATGTPVNASNPEQARRISTYKTEVLAPALADLTNGVIDVPRFVERTTNGAPEK